jgi:hypothetical protein
LAFEVTTDRPCRKPRCLLDAVSTLTLDYRDKVVVVGPLSPSHDPTALDLCAIHADEFNAPRGWTLVRYREQSDWR